MIENINVKVVDGNKTGRSSKDVIQSVIQGESITKGDVGAYLVGVFACRDLAEDDNHTYDAVNKEQWNHCIYKKEWETALDGKDIFTDQQKGLILAGAKLLEQYPHGWGNKAVSQPHVHRFLETWAKESQ